MAYCSRYQVKYSLYRTCEWYKAVVNSVSDTTVEVTYTGDGSSASLQSDVLCNTKKFRYFEFHENVTGIPDTSDEPWQPPGDCIEVSTTVIGIFSSKHPPCGLEHLLHGSCIAEMRDPPTVTWVFYVGY